MTTAAAKVTLCRWLHDAPFAYSMTYDEGTLDTYVNALRVHEKYGFPGHLDVVAGQLGQRRNCFGSSLNGYRHMSADELRDMLSRGWGVGNHSWSHMDYPCMPGLNLYREVVWSKYCLEDELQHPVRIFTIPNDTHNYPPVIDLVKQHYLACANIDGAPNREGYDLYNIGNIILGSGGFRPRPGWPEALKTERLTSDYLRGAWLYETTHLCLPDVPQPHKNVTPEYLDQRFSKLSEVSEGRVWAATPDRVVDYELMRRHIVIDKVRWEGENLCFDVTGDYPVGVMNPTVTLRIDGLSPTNSYRIEQTLHQTAGGYAQWQSVQSIVPDRQHLLVTLQLAPGRTVRLIQNA